MVKKSRWSSKTDVSDVVYGTDGILYLRLIMDLFTDKSCPTLVGKPKLFFLQVGNYEVYSCTIELKKTITWKYWNGVDIYYVKPYPAH